jgi:nucleotide-binding universal stress UspA family protein
MKILIAVDGSPASFRALERVAELTPRAAREATLLMVRVPAADPVLVINEDGFALGSASEEQEAQESLSWSKHCLELAGIPTQTLFRSGSDPAREVLKAAEEIGADMIVVGCHHKSALGRLIKGSVSADLAVHARVPLLIVP